MKYINGRMGAIAYDLTAAQGVDEQALEAVVSAGLAYIMSLEPLKRDIRKTARVKDETFPASRSMGNCASCGISLSQKVHLSCYNP